MRSVAAAPRPATILLLLRHHLSTTASQPPPPLSSTHAFSPALRRLARAQNFAAIESLLEPLKSPPHPRTERHLSSVVTSYASCGLLDHALSTLSLIPSPSSHSLNSLLSSLTHHPSLFHKVPSLFHQLPIKHPSIVPDHVSYSILIKSHCKSRSASTKALPLLQEMRSKNLEVNAVTYTTILDSLYKENKPREAESLWKEMKEKDIALDVPAYNVRLMHRALTGRPEAAVKIIEEMEAAGLQPDAISYNYLIGCYCKNGRFADASRVYEGMKEKGCEPNYVTFKVYLMGLCKMGDLDRAVVVFDDAVKRSRVPDLGAVRMLVEGLMKKKKVRAAKRVVTGLRKKFAEDFVGGWMELEKVVGLNKGGHGGGGDDEEKDVKVIAA